MRWGSCGFGWASERARGAGGFAKVRERNGIQTGVHAWVRNLVGCAYTAGFAVIAGFAWTRSMYACLCLAVLAACPALSVHGQQKPANPKPPVQTDAASGDVRQYCSLSGRVSMPDGEPLPGSAVKVSAPTMASRQAVTDEDGRFVIGELPPGKFVVTVSHEGFTPVTGAVRLAPGANTATAMFTLLPAVSDSMSVYASAKDIAAAEVHLEEQQRMVGVLPNFFVSYIWRATPLTSGQKFRLALRSAADPGNLLLVGTVAGVQQATNAFPGYSQGWKGYGRRYGADLGNLVSGTFMGGAILPTIFRQDPRYFYKADGTVSARFWYAVSRVAVTRGDNGRPEPNYSTMLGDMSAGAISNLYYAPEDRTNAKVTIENGLLGIAGDAMNNVIQEFVLKMFTTNSKRNSLKH